MPYLHVKTTTQLSGQVTPPSSKSQSIRGMMLALLAAGESTLINPLDSADIQDAIRVCRQLGAQISLDQDKLVMRSKGLPLQTDVKEINTGNSGITTHFILPILGLRQHADNPIRVDCGEQMRARPIHPLVDALRSLGLTVYYIKKEGQLPVSVSGQLKGGAVKVSGETSQYLSALLLALPCAPGDSVITVDDLHERSYVDMTLHWLKEQAIQCTQQSIKGRDCYHITGHQHYRPFQRVIAADFSSASYLIAAAVMLPGQVTLQGFDWQDNQGDQRLVPILQEMGAQLIITKQGLRVQGGSPLKGMTIDANDIPDLLPTLAVVGTYAVGKTVLCNVKQARIKETDRIHAMTEGLRRLGAHVDEQADGLTVYQSQLHGNRVRGYDDHRTVMALGLAGMLASGSTYISDGHAIHKTFPTYVKLMCSLGAMIEMTDACAV